MKQFILVLSVFMLGISSCQVEDNDPLNIEGLQSDQTLIVSELNSTVCAHTFLDLWAGQTHNWGYVEIWNDAVNIYVKYVSTEAGETFGALHLWIGADLTLLPKNSQGTPQPGQFPFKTDDDPNYESGGSEYTFTIPFTSIYMGDGVTEYCDVMLYVVAHAEIGAETAFAGSITGTGTARWYFYDTYTICCNNGNPPVETVDQTAFAKFVKEDGGFIFTIGRKSNPENYPSLNLTVNRWGWAGNLSLGQTYTADIWAGAGLNKTSNGVMVGELTVSSIGDEVTVNYQFTGLYTMSEIHLYVGDSAPVTLAPGQYGHTEYFDPAVQEYTTTFTVTDDGDGKFWIIAHAVANLPVQ